MIGTSVIKKLRRSSPIILQKSVLTSFRAEFAFSLFFFFFIWVFFHRYSHSTWQQGNWETISLYPSYHFHSLHRHLDTSCVIPAESLHNWQPDLNRETLFYQRKSLTFKLYALFRIHTFYTCSMAAIERKMLKTRVTLGNISRVLLNLIKKLTFEMFKDSHTLQMFTQLTLIFCL